MDNQTTLTSILTQVAEAVSLAEGATGVEAVLRQIHRNQPVSVKDVASSLGYAIPVVTAIRRELEKRDWLRRKCGMNLSPQAQEILDKIWGIAPNTSKVSSHGQGTESETNLDPQSLIATQLHTKLTEWSCERPSVDPQWDQSHATVETVVKRYQIFEKQGWLTGKRVLFLGDDDLTSLSCLWGIKQQFGPEVLSGIRCVVVELDSRLTDFLTQTATQEGLPIEVIAHDLRQPLPDHLHHSFDFFFTDPPYTVAGGSLFLSRGISALDTDGLNKAALAIPLAPPVLQSGIQQALVQQGLVIDFLYPGFNRYIGASMQGGTSALYGLTCRTRGPKSFFAGNEDGPIYTHQTRSHQHNTPSEE